MKANIGPQGAHTATAHKIAVIFYALVRNQIAHDQRIWEKRDEQRRKRHTAPLKRQAQRLGYKLTPISRGNRRITTPPLPDAWGEVSPKRKRQATGLPHAFKTD